MLDKALYGSWKSRMELYMQNREHGRMILESVQHGPLKWPTIEEDGATRDKKYAELSASEQIQADCDLKATNIILQGLPTDVYALVNHHKVAKDLWEKVQLLMQGTSLTKQERECKMYDEFDKFAYIKEETLHQYYLRFTQLMNDMNIYKMALQQFQVNTKFLNGLPSEWSKFVTDVKLVRDLHTTNFDQLKAYLEQHETHANEIRIHRERYNLDPLALVANQHPSHYPYQQAPLHTFTSMTNPQFSQQYSQPAHQLYTHAPVLNPYDATYHPQYQNPINQPYHNQVSHLSTPSPQQPYLPLPVDQSQHLEHHYDTNLTVPTLQQGDDPLKYITKTMAFVSVVVSHYPSTNNQLRTSSNPINQATIQDGRVTVQQV
ncbi:hypothetical protein Tco_0212595 [Tanacetum coccineum]